MSEYFISFLQNNFIVLYQTETNLSFALFNHLLI